MLSKAGEIESQFKKGYLDLADVLTVASVQCAQDEQDYEHEESIFTFDDYSVLVVDNHSVEEMH